MQPKEQRETVRGGRPRWPALETLHPQGSGPGFVLRQGTRSHTATKDPRAAIKIPYVAAKKKLLFK